MCIKLEPMTLVDEPCTSDDASDGTSIMKVGAKFESFQKFEKVLEDWKKKFYHPLRVASSEQLKEVEVASSIMEQFKYRYVVYHCAHYGQPRMRGVGTRPNQNYLPSGCKAMLRLVFDYEEQMLKITKIHTKHDNHEVTQDSYARVSQKIRKKPTTAGAKRRSEVNPVARNETPKSVKRVPFQQIQAVPLQQVQEEMKPLSVEFPEIPEIPPLETKPALAPTPEQNFITPMPIASFPNFSMEQLLANYQNSMVMKNLFAAQMGQFNPIAASMSFQMGGTIPLPTFNPIKIEPSANSAFSSPASFSTFGAPVSSEASAVPLTTSMLTPDVTPMTTPPLSDVENYGQLSVSHNPYTMEALSLLKSIKGKILVDPNTVAGRIEQLREILKGWESVTV